MKRYALSLFLVFLFALTCRAQGPEIKFIADTLVVQADWTYEADADLATLTFDISSQDKDLKPAYAKASEAMQKIAELAEKNGLKKDDVANGVLTVTPYYGDDKKKRTKSFLVQGQIALKVRDFSKVGTILDGSVSEGITDFRSLTYSLADEESAKQHAVAEAMRRAIGRANAALGEKGQKVGSLRFANLDVKQLVGVSQVEDSSLGGRNFENLLALQSGAADKSARAVPPPPPPPMPRPEKIKVSATVQCAFQIQ